MQISDEMRIAARQAFKRCRPVDRVACQDFGMQQDDIIDQQLEAALTAALAGYVVVPREPTPEMLRRGSVMKLDTALAPGHPGLKENGGKYSPFELMSLETWSAMIDAAPPVSDTPVSGWRDIASAPEDQMVLAYDRVGGQYVFAFKNRDRWAEVGQGESHLPNGYLSHWQPLPTPPVSRGE